MAEILVRLPFLFVSSDHLDARFPEDELKDWSAFDIEALSSDISFFNRHYYTVQEKKYEAILHHPHSMEAINSEYAEFKYIVKQNLKQGSISTFSDMVAAALRCEELKEISELVDICYISSIQCRL